MCEQVKQVFYGFLNGFVLLSKMPVMWLTFKMIVSIFSFIAITFTLAYVTKEPMLIVTANYGLFAIIIFFGYQYYKLYKSKKKNKNKL